EATSVLQETRRKLLDLTARNRLLNFRHTATNSIRVVDELPDQLFKHLIDGSAFTFDPVIEPTKEELRDYYSQKRRVPPELIPQSELEKPRPEEWAQHLGISVSPASPCRRGSRTRFGGRPGDSWTSTAASCGRSRRSTRWRPVW